MAKAIVLPEVVRKIDLIDRKIDQAKGIMALLGRANDADDESRYFAALGGCEALDQVTEQLSQLMAMIRDAKKTRGAAAPPKLPLAQAIDDAGAAAEKLSRELASAFGNSA